MSNYKPTATKRFAFGGVDYVAVKVWSRVREAWVIETFTLNSLEENADIYGERVPWQVQREAERLLRTNEKYSFSFHNSLTITW